MRKPIHLDTAERRRRKRREDRAFDVKKAAGWQCQDCGEPHGKLTEQPDGSYQRVELRTVHRDGNRENWRRDNLRVVCGHCRRNHAATFDTAPRQGGLDRSVPPESSHPNGEAR